MVVSSVIPQLRRSLISIRRYYNRQPYKLLRSRISMYELELIIALSIIFGGWYFIGSYKNRKLLQDVWKSLLEQLEEYTPTVTTRNLGGSAFLAVADKPRRNFRRIEIAFTCLPREILVNYLVSLAIGRKDLLSLMADLESEPKSMASLEDKFRDLKGKVMSLTVKRGKPNVRIVMTADQLLKGYLREALERVREECMEGLC